MAATRSRVQHAIHRTCPSPILPTLTWSRVPLRAEKSKIEIDRAMSLAGVLDVLTWQTLQGQLKPGKFWKKGSTAATTIQALQSDQVRHDGEILAVVLADTFEAAREGAHKIGIEYQKETPTATFDGAGIEVK